MPPEKRIFTFPISDAQEMEICLAQYRQPN